MCIHEIAMPHRTRALGMVLTVLCAVPAVRVHAQAATTLSACYVPTVGAMYLIKQPGLPPACLAPTHVEIDWQSNGTVAAGGDLAGTLLSPTVTKLQGRAVSATAPVDGQVLQWVAAGANWVPTTPGAGVAGGDLLGTLANATVAKLRGIQLSAAVPISGQVMTYDGLSNSWLANTSPLGVTAHGLLTGLLADDHPQYLLAGGARASINGFAVTSLAGGTIPATGPGSRLMWYGNKRAFRAGNVTAFQWDDVNVGLNSVAMGSSTVASGIASTALGASAVASGDNTLAAGLTATASGLSSVALGDNVTASGANSVALGQWASTNAFAGSFVFGDASGSGASIVKATAAHQFMVRASGGLSLNTNTALTTGCNLPAGSGVFACASSRSLKTAFGDLSGDTVLARIRALPVQTWQYKDEAGHVTHAGPFAEDFRAAFGLGTDDRTIGLLDISGVTLAAAKALEERTRVLQSALDAKDSQLSALRQELTAMRSERSDILRRIEALEKQAPR
jgi:hypothetical protein